MRNSFYQRTIGWYLLKLRFAVGRMLTRLGVPGFVRDCSVESWLNHDHIAIRVAGGCTVISVNGFDMFFDRVTGTLDGQGCGDCKAA
jgi:hypothetical protein